MERLHRLTVEARACAAPRATCAPALSPAVGLRCIKARMYRGANDLMADREQVYLYDEDELEEWEESSRPPEKLQISQLAELRGEEANTKPLAVGMQEVLVGNRKDLPATYVGPVEVSLQPGAGYVLKATDMIYSGDLILCSLPLCALVGPPGTPPDPAALVAAVQRARWPAAARAAFPQLFAGVEAEPPLPPDALLTSQDASASTGSTDLTALTQSRLPPAPVLPLSELAELEEELGGVLSVEEMSALMAGRNIDPRRHRLPPSLETLGASVNRGRVEGRLGSKLPLKLQPDRVAAAVRFNSLSTPHQDLTSTTLRREQLVSLTGIWPLAAMANHTCSPNASYMFLGPVPEAAAEAATVAADTAAAATSADGSAKASAAARRRGSAGDGETMLGPGVGPRLLVRATATIYPGEEVTLNYLEGDRGALAPLETRRRQLKERWGFECRCRRCLEEASAGRSIGSLQWKANQAAAVAAAAAARQQAAQLQDADGGSTTTTSNSSSSSSGSSSVYSDLLKAQRTLDDEIQLLGVSSEAKAGLQAGIFPAFWQLTAIKMAANPEAVQSLASVGVTMEVVKDVLPGCEVHVLLACLLAEGARDKWGEKDVHTQTALAEAYKAIQLHYGPMEPSFAKQLLPAAAAWAEAQLLGLPLQQVPELLGLPPHDSNINEPVTAEGGDWLKETEDEYSEAAVQREFEAMLEEAAEEVIELSEEQLRELREQEEREREAERLEEESKRQAIIADLVAEQQVTAAASTSTSTSSASVDGGKAPAAAADDDSDDGIPLKDIAAYLTGASLDQPSNNDTATTAAAGTPAAAAPAEDVPTPVAAGATRASGRSRSDNNGDLGTTTTSAAQGVAADGAAAGGGAAAAEGVSSLFTSWLAGEQVFSPEAAAAAAGGGVPGLTPLEPAGHTAQQQPAPTPGAAQQRPAGAAAAGVGAGAGGAGRAVPRNALPGTNPYLSTRQLGSRRGVGSGTTPDSSRGRSDSSTAGPGTSDSSTPRARKAPLPLSTLGNRRVSSSTRLGTSSSPPSTRGSSSISATYNSGSRAGSDDPHGANSGSQTRAGSSSSSSSSSSSASASSSNASAPSSDAMNTGSSSSSRGGSSKGGRPRSTSRRASTTTSNTNTTTTSSSSSGTGPESPGLTTQQQVAEAQPPRDAMQGAAAAPKPRRGRPRKTG